jgi:hypothetical protein
MRAASYPTSVAPGTCWHEPVPHETPRDGGRFGILGSDSRRHASDAARWRLYGLSADGQRQRPSSTTSSASNGDVCSVSPPLHGARALSTAEAPASQSCGLRVGCPVTRQLGSLIAHAFATAGAASAHGVPVSLSSFRGPTVPAASCADTAAACCRRACLATVPVTAIAAAAQLEPGAGSVVVEAPLPGEGGNSTAAWSW